MKKIVMYCRLSNERDLASHTENEESIESDRPTNESEQTDEENKEGVV